MTLNREPKIEKYILHIYPNEDYLEKISDIIQTLSAQSGMNYEIADIVELAIVEACNNALNHGDQGDLPIDLEISIDDRAIKAIIQNTGNKINFSEKEPFNVNQNFLNYRNGGLGIPLIKKLMDDVIYDRTPDHKNKLTLIKYFNKEDHTNEN